MSAAPVQLIVAAFAQETSAKEALKALKQAKKERLIGIMDAAVLSRDADGKLKIKDTMDVGGGKGAAFGGVVGAAVGIIGGPLLLIPAAVGALVGGLTAKLIQSGFPKERLAQIGEALKPGQSAIIAVIEHKWVAEVQRMLAEAEATLVTEALASDIAAQLDAGNEALYTAIASEEGLVAATASMPAALPKAQPEDKAQAA